MVQTSRSFTFWILFSGLSALSAITAIYLFPRAFPIVQLDVTIDRLRALDEARSTAQKYNLGPDNAQYSASFIADDVAKTFVELECGGATRFMEIISQNLYQPYTWHVRIFKPYDAHEVLIKYTPNGTLYGFTETLSEELHGKSISATQAQAIAQDIARTQWNIDLSHYALAESSQETVASGRIDHSFVYERTDQTIGEGFYRLLITVSGDRVTQINHFIRVPDNFMRRYQQMRTANDTIAWIARLLILFLYIFGGIIGLIFFMRRRSIIWRYAIISGTSIALLLFCTKINELPLLWMHYQTALSPVSFILQVITYSVYQFVYTGLLYTIIFAIAETFTRSALGWQPQFWQLWSTSSASSLNIVRATLTGYLAVPFFMLFVIVFYIIANHQFAWWIPSQAFFEPNILATYVPWISSLSQALGAGFMEECLFRAIPIAGAILLSKKYGRQNFWVILAFIVQAFIFGAAHANYPMQPAYARVIELLIPSCGFGALYYFAGLFPAVIAHVIYDVVWMALPIFMNHAPHAFVHKIIVILISMIPLWIILYARIKAGKWSELSVTAHNDYWRPHIATHHTSNIQIEPTKISIGQWTQYSIYTTALIGFAIWIASAHFTADVPPMRIDRTQALTLAQKYFATHGIKISHPWKLLTSISDDESISAQHAFVWQTGGTQIYKQLQGTYVSTPRWIVRAAHFEGDIVARAQEYHLYLNEIGDIVRMRHLLPETHPGTTLTQAQARATAHETIGSQYHLDPTTLTEISAQEEKHPARKDWVFIFADQNGYPLPTGQARIYVAIAGDEVVDTYQYIFVPQEWRRSYENLCALAGIIKQLCGLCIYLIFITATLASLWYMVHTPTVPHTSPFILFLFFALIFLLNIANGIPKMTFSFNTCKPWNTQLLIMIASWCISALIKAATLSGSCSMIHVVQTYYRIINSMRSRIALGCSIGIIFSASFSAMQRFITATHPLWTTYNYLNSFVPVYDYLSTQLVGYLSFTFLIILIILISRHLMRLKKYRYLLSSIFVCACGFIFAGAYYANNIPLLLAIGSATTILLLVALHTVFIFDYTLVPIATASYTILTLLQESLTSPYAYTYIAIMLIGCTSIGWYLVLNKESVYQTNEKS